MYPYLKTFMGTWELYDIMNIAGAVVAVLIQMVMLYRGTKRIRCILFSAFYGICSWIGTYVGSFVRQSAYGKQIEGNILENIMRAEGKHFLGTVLTGTLFSIPFILFLCKVLRLKKEHWQNTQRVALNALAVGLLVQHVFVRMGCFLRGCCHGRYYNGMFSIRLPYTSIDYPVFPTQLMEAGISLILLVIVILMIRKKKEVFGMAVMGYAVNIFITEYFMDQKGYGMVWGITIIQWWAIALFILGISHHLLWKSRFLLKWRGQ